MGQFLESNRKTFKSFVGRELRREMIVKYLFESDRLLECGKGEVAAESGGGGVVKNNVRIDPAQLPLQRAFLFLQRVLQLATLFPGRWNFFLRCGNRMRYIHFEPPLFGQRHFNKWRNKGGSLCVRILQIS